MELPKYHETFIPILEVLNTEESLHHRDLGIRIRDKYYSDLPQDLLDKKTSTGTNVLLDRIGWGKSYLKMGKIVDYPERGMVRITKKGKLILKSGKFTLEDLKNDLDFIAYRKAQETRRENEIEEVSIENASPQDLIDSGFSTIEKQIKTELLDKLRNIDPYYFEKVILVLLKKMGYGDFIETSRSRDGGIDGIINEDKLGLEKIYVQTKRYSEKRIYETEIRNFIGAMSRGTKKGVFVTTSSFNDNAIYSANDADHTIILIDGNKLVDLMHQYSVGVEVSNVYEVKEIDEDFFEGN